MRPSVTARPAQPGDVEELVDLCLEAREESAVGAQLCTGVRSRLRDQLRAGMGTPGALVLVAGDGAGLVGMLLGRIVGPGLYHDRAHLFIEAVYVTRGRRRHGNGHALIQLAVHCAEEVGADQVLALPLPGARGMQRFLARLGFAPAAAHRFVSTSALQRRLAELRPAGTGRGLDDIIARRRALRRRPADQEPDVPGAPGPSSSMQVSRAVQTRVPFSSSRTIA